VAITGSKQVNRIPYKRIEFISCKCTKYTGTSHQTHFTRSRIFL